MLLTYKYIDGQSILLDLVSFGTLCFVRSKNRTAYIYYVLQSQPSLSRKPFHQCFMLPMNVIKISTLPDNRLFTCEKLFSEFGSEGSEPSVTNFAITENSPCTCTGLTVRGLYRTVSPGFSVSPLEYSWNFIWIDN